MNSPEVPPDVEFTIPTWAGKPSVGLHLDVFKGDKLIQKLMIDEKRCYFFGRNPRFCDFAIDHASCSRVHAALLYHKHLNRAFLVDLGSTHGTFIGTVRLEAYKPEQLLLDQVFHFGASSRRYILRERPSGAMSMDETEALILEGKSAKLLGLPEEEEELENLTEYNTALNRRIATMTVPEEDFKTFKRKHHAYRVSFNDEEEIINPEDIDPTIGRFRNLVETALISRKKPRIDLKGVTINNAVNKSSTTSGVVNTTPAPLSGLGMNSKLGVSFYVNIAPDVDLYPPSLPEPSVTKSFPDKVSFPGVQTLEKEPKKKKYPIEAWPGKLHGQHLLL